MSAHKISQARRRREALVQGVGQFQVVRKFPSSFVPIVTMLGGKIVVRLMRYQCRPAHVERRMENLLESPHHARKERLQGRWQREFGHTHGVIAVGSFFEAVALHRLRNRQLAKGEGLAALELGFLPCPRQTLYVACLWSHWHRSGRPDLLSFATIVDPAPDEVQAVGQDLCPVVIKRENVLAWLNPDPTKLADSYDILDDCRRSRTSISRRRPSASALHGPHQRTSSTAASPPRLPKR
jgi:putative SOS response-associated peptidase YedK